MRNSDIPIYTESDLLERLSDGVLSGKREVIFLVGAPVSAPKFEGQKGVLDVDGVIGLILKRFGSKPAILRELNKLLRRKALNRYQEAFKFLLGKRSQDVANEIIKEAVLHARVDGIDLCKQLSTLTTGECDALELDVNSWSLSPAVTHIGQIIAKYPQLFGKRILTSNFDPLIELGITSAGASYYRTVLSGDGSVTNTAGPGCNVVHFHGYWSGSDTLHTPLQLTHSRPQLRNSLTTLLSNATLVVVAYGGWDDVFTNALVDVISDYGAAPDVLWTFHESNEARLQSNCAELLNKLAAGLNRSRVTAYKGIDCNDFFRKLMTSLEQAEKNELNENINTSAETIETKPTIDSNEARVISKEISATSKKQLIQAVSDSPPRVDVWVGREDEIATIGSTNCPVVVITGIGGQGKSALAATYLSQVAKSDTPFEFWDWRDCKEEGDRLSTQISLIIERLTNGETRASDLEGQDIRSLTDVFFQSLQSRRCLFVFDNVDHYIDLALLRPASSLEIILKKATQVPHSSMFIVTCRPNIQTTDPGVLPIHLKDGLSENETLKLFSLRGVKIEKNETSIVETRNLVAGHALWLNLIAVQVAGNRTTLPRLLASIKKGQPEVAQSPSDSMQATLKANQKIILDPIWETLKDNQRIILRTMAEMVRPEPVDRLSNYLRHKMFAAQFSKHVTILIALNLIVVKPRDDDSDLLDLHPIVRDYIRGRFRQAEQDPFITSIIVALDLYIKQYRKLLGRDTSLEILEYWTTKVELHINQKDFKAATETLNDIKNHLIVRGYPEEFVRVSRKLFEVIDWPNEFQARGKLDVIFDEFINCLVQSGERHDAEALLVKYESAISGKGSQFISLCNLRCYLYWFYQAYELAIEWGERGVKLKKQTDADISASCDHNLALARRDSGQCKEALAYFLESTPIESVIDPQSLDATKSPEFYGNIGRCLELMGASDKALPCYKKSALLLERNPPYSHGKLNKGYIRFWIGEAFFGKGQIKEAYLFLLAAAKTWDRIAPPRAANADEKSMMICANHTALVESVSALDQEQIENECKRWFFGKELRL